MLRPQFRYSHDLVVKLLDIERARGASIGGNSDDCPSEATLAELRASLGDPSHGYRHSSGLIFNQARTDIVYVPPGTDDVPELTAELMNWLAECWDSVAGVVLAGVVEEELLLIQPFERNNGAVARLAGDAILRRKGYGFARIQEQIAREPAAYVEASHSCHMGAYSETADLSQWLEYFAGVVAGAAREAVPAQPPAAGVEPAYTGPTILRERQIQALQFIRSNGAIRSGQYQRLASIVPDTARRDFDDLMAKGLVEVRGVGRATHYLLTARGAEEAERRRVS
jgi:Fic family protein